MQLSFSLDSQFLRAAINKHVKSMSNWFDITVIDTLDKGVKDKIPLSSAAIVKGKEIQLVSSNIWSLSEAVNTLIVSAATIHQGDGDAPKIKDWLNSFEFDADSFSTEELDYFQNLINDKSRPLDDRIAIALPQIPSPKNQISRLEGHLRDMAPDSDANRAVLETVLEDKSKIEDFGEHIPMARKHIYELSAILEELESNQEDKDFAKGLIGKLTKSVIWEKPDSISMVNVHGYEPFAAFMINETYGSILANPKFKSNADAAIYIQEVSRLKEMLMQAKTERDVRGVYREFIKPYQNDPQHLFLSMEGRDRVKVIGGQKVLNALKITPSMEKRASISFEDGWPEKLPIWKKGYRYETDENGLTDIYKGETRSIKGPFNTEADADDHLKYLHYSKTLEVRKDKLDPDLLAIYRKLSSAGAYRYLKGGFFDKKEAKEYLHDFAEELYNQKPPHIIRPELADIYRKGPSDRKLENITTDDFSASFGVRGGQFGNWNNNQDRQGFLNDCYDAFNDLARVLDVPSLSIGMGGRLAMAFGARGVSGARAHYEPHYEVINLTKKNGAGVLAHEWFHALDHQLFKHFSESDKPLYLTNSTLREKLPVSLQDSLNNLMRSLKYRPATKEEAVESVSDRISESNHIVQRLGSVFRKGLGDEEQDRPKLQKIAKNLNQIAKGEAGKLVIGNGRRSYSKIEELVDIYSEKHDPENIKTQIGSLVNVAETVREQHILFQAYESGQKTLEVQTDFIKDANALDSSRGKPYWSQNIELAARAFEAFIYDSLEEREEFSQFLVNGVSAEDNERFREKYGNGAYPSSEDRQHINKCFKQFIEEIRPCLKEQLKLDNSVSLEVADKNNKPKTRICNESPALIQ